MASDNQPPETSTWSLGADLYAGTTISSYAAGIAAGRSPSTSSAVLQASQSRAEAPITAA